MSIRHSVSVRKMLQRAKHPQGSHLLEIAMVRTGERIQHSMSPSVVARSARSSIRFFLVCDLTRNGIQGDTALLGLSLTEETRKAGRQRARSETHIFFRESRCQPSWSARKHSRVCAYLATTAPPTLANAPPKHHSHYRATVPTPDNTSQPRYPEVPSGQLL